MGGGGEDERSLDLLTKGVEEEGADEDEGETEADEEGDDASDEERGASVLLQKQVKVENLDGGFLRPGPVYIVCLYPQGGLVTRPPWGYKDTRQKRGDMRDEDEFIQHHQYVQ